MKNNDIIFWTDIEGLPEIEPVTLSQNFIPEWFQNIPSFSKHKENITAAGEGATIKMCPGLEDFFKIGYVVPLWCDVYVELKNEDEWRWRVPYAKFDFDIHPTWQYKDYLPPEAHKNTALILKAYCPWKVKTPKGVSLLQLPMSYHFDARFSLMSGIIHTDMHHWINQQLVINKEGETLIPRGTPLGMYVPIRRENYNLIVREETKEDIKRLERSAYRLKSKFLGSYKSIKKHLDK